MGLVSVRKKLVNFFTGTLPCMLLKLEHFGK